MGRGREGGDIILIDPQSNWRAYWSGDLEELRGRVAARLLIWDQARHPQSSESVQLIYTPAPSTSTYAPCVTMLPPSDLFVH